MFEALLDSVPDHWRGTMELVLAPLSWIPDMQASLLDLFVGSSGLAAVMMYVLLLLPMLLWTGGVWCTQLSLYTLPFRSGRVSFVTTMLLAWWDAARMVWMYWVGLFRLGVIVAGWAFTLGRLAIRLLAEAFRQVVMMPFTFTGRMTASYFQPGVPWIAFVLLVFWCLLEATIFTYTLYPTVSELVADLVGADTAPPALWPILYFFLFILIMGSFACVQTLADAVKQRQYKFMVQMILVEVFVMFFEVLFLYRELVDAITPWIAQQTGVRMGLTFTLTLATFGWIGVRGMNWFLFGQFGTPPLLAFISRQPLAHGEASAKAVVVHDEPHWWQAPLQDFKRETDWLHEKSEELLEYLALPVLHLFAAVLNFCMILVTARPIFSLPFGSLKEVMKAKALLTELHARPPVLQRATKGAEL
jgi:hypothetical protein